MWPLSVYLGYFSYISNCISSYFRDFYVQNVTYLKFHAIFHDYYVLNHHISHISSYFSWLLHIKLTSHISCYYLLCLLHIKSSHFSNIMIFCNFLQIKSSHISYYMLFIKSLCISYFISSFSLKWNSLIILLLVYICKILRSF